jgi:hypothetical protein
MKTPHIEILYTEGCANAGPTGSLVEEVAGDLVPGAQVQRVLVRDPPHARELRFPGSPTVRVDGADIEGDMVVGVGFW